MPDVVNVGESVFGDRARMSALLVILQERCNQDAKWGYVQHNGPEWL